MYAGLTTADKGALLDAKARGAEWVARDKDDELVAFRLKPQKYVDMELNSDHWERTQTGNYFLVMPSDEPLQFIQWSDPDPVNIDLALAQIAEMESKENNALSEKASEKGCAEKPQGMPYLQPFDDNGVTNFKAMRTKPLTMNERINQMTVEEKVEWLNGSDYCRVTEIQIFECDAYKDCKECMRAFLNSPYTEGETDEG